MHDNKVKKAVAPSQLVIEPYKYYTHAGEIIYSHGNKYLHLDEKGREIYRSKKFDINDMLAEEADYEYLFRAMVAESDNNYEEDLDELLKITKKEPIVVGGCGRSGTTLLLSILGSHSSIGAFDEELYCFYPGPYRIKRLINAIKDSGFENKRWCEKTPKNIKIFGNLLHIFKKHVKLIHVVRDGRDVITSVHPAHPGRYWVPTQRWIEDVEAGLECDEHIHRVRYEDIVLNTESALRSLCDFIEEPFEKEMLDYVSKTSVLKNIAWEGKALPIHANKIGKWKRPEHAKVVEEFMNNKKAVNLLQTLGYKV